MLGLSLGWRFLADPSLSAPTRDPAWYTWRAQVILDSNPNRVVQEWGPHGLFSAGYRVSVPVMGALLQRVAGIDRYTFSTLFMIGIPLLAGLALGAAFYRSRRNPLVIHMAILAAVALFLSTPYIGYLDNATVLFLLCLTIPFLETARTSWGARTALFLIGIAAAFTHPTTCVIFGGILLAVFGWHFLTSRFSFGSALKSDGPMLMSVGFGMIAGLSAWVIGIWGSSASFADAALPPPYTAAFFTARLKEWVLSMQPVIIVPFVVVAIASTILRARRTHRPARNEELGSIWWLLAFAGALTVISGKAIPYYRFMNASAASMALLGLGAFAAIHWFFTDRAPSKLIAWAGVGLVVWSRPRLGDARRLERRGAGLDLRRDAAGRRARRAARLLGRRAAARCRGRVGGVPDRRARWGGWSTTGCSAAGSPTRTSGRTRTCAHRSRRSTRSCRTPGFVRTSCS